MDLLKKANESLRYYEVQKTEGVPIICEDGEYRVRPGYVVHNTVFGVDEHTTTLLPGAIFQAQHLDATLIGLLNPEEQNYPSLQDVPMEDVVAN